MPARRASWAAPPAPRPCLGSTVTVPVEQLNAKLPTGFKALEAGADYTVDITADEAQNVIDVTL